MTEPIQEKSLDFNNKSNFSFDLPDALIARHPLAERRASRLLSVSAGGDLNDLVFGGVTELLQAGDLLVVNNSKVMKARLYGNKEANGGHIEMLVERITHPQFALAYMKSNKKIRIGLKVRVHEYLLEVVRRDDDMFCLELLDTQQDFMQLLAQHGTVPLPPYLKRKAEKEDIERYQTVYAQTLGSIAAPTAGLHFDEALLEECREEGIAVMPLTLHVGIGTFQPIRQESLDLHAMHKESFVIDEALCAALEACTARGGRVVAVGSTVMRALESSAAQNNGLVKPGHSETNLFIRPGYDFKVVDCMITNFHLPESSLLVLVSAFAGYTRICTAYAHAIEQQYRFFSYGDAMWLERGTDAV
ncbi:MAG: tRNA preQ1(34) S-adenosylmethionine ribosyltransferase-isomerase QueA [Candidatus Oxydemutatoraceae bacterium WSBS_2016_MAG_OTU14]